MNTFIYENNGFRKYDFSEILVGALVRGPYCIKFEAQGFDIPIYYAGRDNKMNTHLIAKGKLTIPMSELIDRMADFSFWSGKDLRDSIDLILYKDMIATISKAGNHLAQTSIFRDLETIRKLKLT